MINDKLCIKTKQKEKKRTTERTEGNNGDEESKNFNVKRIYNM